MCDGHIVYQGAPHNVGSHFTGMFEFPRFCNPADIAMKILSINYPKKKEDEEYVQSLVANYNKENAAKEKEIS